MFLCPPKKSEIFHKSHFLHSFGISSHFLFSASCLIELLHRHPHRNKIGKKRSRVFKCTSNVLSLGECRFRKRWICHLGPIGLAKHEAYVSQLFLLILHLNVSPTDLIIWIKENVVFFSYYKYFEN